MHPLFVPRRLSKQFRFARPHLHIPKMRTQSPTSPMGGHARLPKQLQRALPIYIALVFVVLLFANFDSFTTVKIAKHKREVSRSIPASAQGIAAKGPKFPRKIWQTWKIDALGFEQRDLLTARTWTLKNPGHRYEVLTDNNDMYYVESHFGPNGIDRPDIVEMYRAVTAKIIKADILRYLIMYVEGGVYADIDVEDLKPVDRWIPDRYSEANVDAVISVEIDEPEFKDHPILGKKSMSFCQWTFLSKPGLPVFLKLVENIMDWLKDLSQKQNVPISDLKLDFDEVISGTGPSAFTNAVLEAMSINKGEHVTWNTFHNMAESKLVGGFLVLTVEAFAAGQGHSDSGNHNARTALVKHHYHASLWPTNHPRYNHPIYGEVERCNWDFACIKLWDSNIASFDALSPEEKAVRIALAEADAQRLALMPKEEPAIFPSQPMLPDKPLFPNKPVFPDQPFPDQQQPLFPPAAPESPMFPPAQQPPQPIFPPTDAPVTFPSAADPLPSQPMVPSSENLIPSDANMPSSADVEAQTFSETQPQVVPGTIPESEADAQPNLGLDGLS